MYIITIDDGLVYVLPCNICEILFSLEIPLCVLFPHYVCFGSFYAQIMCKDWEAWPMSLGNLYKLSDTLIKGIWFSHILRYWDIASRKYWVRRNFFYLVNYCLILMIIFVTILFHILYHRLVLLCLNSWCAKHIFEL